MACLGSPIMYTSIPWLPSTSNVRKASPSKSWTSSMNILSKQFSIIANSRLTFAFFALYDSTRQVYGSAFPLDLINLDLNQFDGNEFSISWLLDSSDDTGPGNEFNGDASYQVFGRIDSLQSVSQVPVPSAAWLFTSALVGLVVIKRKS